ncbi:MAG: type II toxin-antitoxin system HicB family antitoxin [Spirochaetes bacterium]|nr:type II toxin-antitoxin system HicB family antitoxin [Spirochaetota bacterium]
MENYKINLQLETLENGKILATTDDVPGLIAQGRTIQETIEIAQDAARKIIESYNEHGDPLPSTLKVLSEKISADIAVAI